MSSEKVEYNEIRCNKLVLGNEETGFVELGVIDNQGSPNLVLSQNLEATESAIILGFNDGIPTIELLNIDGGEMKSFIGFRFTNNGYPILNMSKKSDAGESRDVVDLGFNSEGYPTLFLLNSSGEDDAVVSLRVDDNGCVSLFLTNENVKGANVVLRVDKDAACMITGTNDRIKNEKNQGVLILTGPNGSSLSLEGKESTIQRRQGKELDSEV